MSVQYFFYIFDKNNNDFVSPLFSGLLFNIFNCLYNNDVISEEGFDAWLACSDPAEQEGKGVASKSTHHFFTWMRENDDNEGEDEE